MQTITKALILLVFLCLSCSKKENASSLTYKEQKNNFSHLSEKQEESDTIVSKKSPIKIISCRIQKSQYSEHKDIHITYKNVSGKTIQAIKFEWNCRNAFDKPSNGKYFFEKGRSEGNCTKPLKPGASNSKVWEDFSTDAVSITSSRAYYVVFTDGKKWKLQE